MDLKPTKLNPELYPEPLFSFLKDADVFDSSCSEKARVFFIDREDGLFLKESAAGSLETEAALTGYFHSLGLAAEVLFHGTDGGRDLLLTRRLPGEDGISPEHLAEPERLCDLTASLLRTLHEAGFSRCPVQDRNGIYAGEVRQGIRTRRYNPKHFAGMYDFGSFEEAAAAAEKGIRMLRKDSLLHGDYCLPNVILDGWRLSGFVDLGSGGAGDRHVDLLSGIWSLRYNLRTNAYADRFLDAYGRDLAEPEKLRYMAAMETVAV